MIVRWALVKRCVSAGQCGKQDKFNSCTVVSNDVFEIRSCLYGRNHHVAGILGVIQGDLGTAFGGSTNVRDFELGDRVETILSGVQDFVLLWIGKTKERTQDWLDENKCVSRCDHVIPACCTGCVRLQEEALVLFGLG